MYKRSHFSISCHSPGFQFFVAYAYFGAWANKKSSCWSNEKYFIKHGRQPFKWPRKHIDYASHLSCYYLMADTEIVQYVVANMYLQLACRSLFNLALERNYQYKEKHLLKAPTDRENNHSRYFLKIGSNCQDRSKICPQVQLYKHASNKLALKWK